MGIIVYNRQRMFVNHIIYCGIGVHFAQVIAQNGAHQHIPDHFLLNH